jgi:hypothetical protein
VDINGLISVNQDRISYAVAFFTGTVSAATKLSEILKRRSLSSKTDMLLTRIQGLVAVQQALGQNRNVKAQLDEALEQFATVSHDSTEQPREATDLGFLQRAFLLYRPPTGLAWIPHTLCWILLPTIPLAISGIWIDNEWDNAATFGVLFFFVLFLLARWWAVSELSRYLKKQGPLAVLPKRLYLSRLASVLYGTLATTYLIGGIVAAHTDLRAGLKLITFGIIVVGCALTLWLWSTLRRDRSMAVAKRLLLLLPPLVLTMMSLFDIGGIIEKQYRGDFLGYWNSWVTTPAIPLLLIPFVVLPLYAGISCCKQKTKRPI